MAKAEEFLEALRRKGETVDEHWQRQHKSWRADLLDLRESIRTWMKPVIDAGLAEVSDKDFETTEPDLGTYMAPGLEILSHPLIL